MKDKTKITWSELLYKLENTHTISIKDICMMLKTSRSWVNKYISYKVDKVYINSGIRAGKLEGTNWMMIASKMLGKDIQESIWFDEEQFYNLMYNSVVSITKQTRKIPFEYLMKDQEAYKKFYKNIQKKYDEVEKSEELSHSEKTERYLSIDQELKKYHENINNYTSSGWKLYKNQPSITKRGEVKRIEYSLDDLKIYCLEDMKLLMENFTAPHDKKEYGDTDEKIYREFFKEGYVRLEIAVSDKKNVESRKVYYIKDELYLKSDIDSYITITDEDFIKNFLNNRNENKG